MTDGSLTKPCVYIFAGPNGSGKTTAANKFIAKGLPQSSLEFINADEIAKSLESEIPDYEMRNMRAANIAEERRRAALRDGRSFAFETVMSTPEKIALMTQARELGYKVSLIFLTTDDAEKNVQRVEFRVKYGGHGVKPEDVRRRYNNVMELLACAFEKADCAIAFDNSDDLPVKVALKKNEQLKFFTEKTWVSEKLAKPYMDRLRSQKEPTKLVSDGREVKPAEAVHGKDYVGTVIEATQWHVLQEVDTQVVLHDRQLMATTSFVQGQKQTISYRYKHGKIVPLDSGGECTTAKAVLIQRSSSESTLIFTERTMSSDDYILTDEFAELVSDAVKEAVAELEALGIKPKSNSPKMRSDSRFAITISVEKTPEERTKNSREGAK